MSHWGVCHRIQGFSVTEHLQRSEDDDTEMLPGERKAACIFCGVKKTGPEIGYQEENRGRLGPGPCPALICCVASQGLLSALRRSSSAVFSLEARMFLILKRSPTFPWGEV